MAGQAPQPPKDPFVAVWFALGLLFALIVGVAAGALSRLGGDNLSTAVLTGGGAFGGTLTLVVLVIKLFKH
jgi:hypothetical protein